MKNSTKEKTVSLTPGGISLCHEYGECGSVDAKDSAERGKSRSKFESSRFIRTFFNGC